MNEEDVVLTGELVSEELALAPAYEQVRGTLALLGKAQQALLEARTLDDFRAVMAAADIASDAATQQAKLLEARGVVAEVVRQATEAANDAAAVRIEAQAQAGGLLIDMRERGERLTREEGGTRRKDRVLENGIASKPSLVELIGGDPAVARAQASIWQRVASVPSEIRSAYIRMSKEDGDEITTAALLRFAREPKEPKQDGRSTIELGYDFIVKSLTEVTGYDPVVMAGEAINTNRKTKYVQLMQKAGNWIEASLDALGQ